MVKRARTGRGRLNSIELLPEICAPLIAKAASHLRNRDRSTQSIYEEFFDDCLLLQAEIHGEPEFDIPSKSAFNRYSIKLATLSHRLDETRRIAEAISEKFDAKASDDLTLIAAEAIKTLVFEVLTAAGDAGLEPKGAMALASALHKATQAQAVSSARREKIEKDFAKKVGNTLTTLEKEAGLSAERAADLRRQLLGVRK